MMQFLLGQLYAVYCKTLILRFTFTQVLKRVLFIVLPSWLDIIAINTDNLVLKSFLGGQCWWNDAKGRFKIPESPSLEEITTQTFKTRLNMYVFSIDITGKRASLGQNQKIVVLRPYGAEKSKGRQLIILIVLFFVMTIRRFYIN